MCVQDRIIHELKHFSHIVRILKKLILPNRTIAF